MLPDQSLSLAVRAGSYLFPDGDVISPLEDFELGGVALNDPSQGLQVQRWRAFTNEDRDTIFVQADNQETPVTVVSGLDPIRELALAFDQNMRPQLAWSTASSSFFRWYDTAVEAQVITEYANEVNLRLGMDDKRETQEQANDVILSYLREGVLYFRAQRDRYLVEYFLSNTGPGRLLRVGMTDVNRFQWEFMENADPTADTWPLGSGIWEIPKEAGFSVGERVGAWAERHGFLGFYDVEAVDDRQVLYIDVPDAEGEEPTMTLVVGYPYTARLRLLPLSEADERGPMLGRKRRLIRTILAVEDAVALLANDVPVLQQTGDSQGRELVARTGEFECRFLGWTNRDRLEVEAPSPYDATIRAVNREYSV